MSTTFSTTLDLLPPGKENTIPTARERAIAAHGGPDAVAQATGRLVVTQTDGMRLIAPPDLRALAEAAAAMGILAELVNGEGTAPKPELPTHLVIAWDEDGNEVRTILTDTPAKRAAAVRAQQAQGLKVEVKLATHRNLVDVLTRRGATADEQAAIRAYLADKIVDGLEPYSYFDLGCPAGRAGLTRGGLSGDDGSGTSARPWATA